VVNGLSELGTVGAEMTTYRLRRKRNARTGAVEYAIGVPQGVGDCSPEGQRYAVTTYWTGAVLYTPVGEDGEPVRGAAGPPVPG
jgi:hypothetical protein